MGFEKRGGGGGDKNMALKEGSGEIYIGSKGEGGGSLKKISLSFAVLHYIIL